MKKGIQRKLAKQALGQRAGKEHMLEWQAPKINNRHGRVFANSEKAREFNRIHAGIFPMARRLIQEKFEHIQKGKIVTDKECTVAVQKARTGKEPGTKNFLTMKVTVEGTGFFVKLAKPHLIEANINGLVLADKFLMKKGYKQGKFNVRAIMPLKAVTFKGVSYMMTEFLGPDEVVQVSEMRNAGEITKCIRELDKELSKIRVYDALPVNAFYHKKTNTILLFDLVA